MANYEEIAKLLVIIGGVVAVIEAILGIIGFYGWFGLGIIVGLVLGVVALLCALRPDDPIPWNWILLVVLGIVMIIFATFIGGALVLVGGILLFLEKK